jgi:hypothetical protein
MKILIALLILFSYSALACNRSVNSKKAVLFVDTNAGYSEIRAAKEAACSRGEKFILIPDNDISKIKEVEQAYAKKFWHEKNTIRVCADTGWNSGACQNMRDKEKELKQAFSDKKKALVKDPNFKKVNNDNIKEKLKELAQEGVKPQSLIMSGHNGGSDISGVMGLVEKQEVLSDMNDVYKDQPELLSEFNSLLLWGCWTNTMDKTTAHKLEMPSLDVIAGFHGMGPLNIYEASPTLMKSVLLKEDQMARASGPTSLKRVIDGLDNVHYTLAGIYTDLSCGGEYYYHRTGDSNRTTTHFGEFKADVDCYDLNETLRPKAQQINSYMSGSEPVPEDNSSSPLRAIYSYARQNAIFKDQCPSISNITALDGNKIGLLRFFDGVKENFDKVYANEREEMWQALKALKGTDLEKSLLRPFEKDLTDASKRLKEIKEQQADLSKELDGYHKNLAQARNDILINNKSLRTKLEKAGLENIFDVSADQIRDDELLAIESFMNHEVSRNKHKNLLQDYIVRARDAKLAYSKVLDKNEPLAIAQKEYDTVQQAYMDAKLNTQRLSESLSNIEEPKSATEFKYMSRKQINSYVHSFDALANFPKSILNKNKETNTEKLISSSKKHVQTVDRLLVNLDTDCMGFLDWHEADETHTPTVECEELRP